MSSAHWKRHAAIAALFVAFGTAAPALAAQPKGKPPSAAADAAKATALFTKGAELFKAKKYAQAMEQFKASYAAVPSPNSHLYIARCLAAMGDTRAAYFEFTKVIEEATARAATEEKYVPTRDSAKVERDELSPKLALVTVNVTGADPSARVRVGRYDLSPDQWGKPFPVEPSTVDVVLEAPGKPPVKRSLTVAAGERSDVNLDAGAHGPVAVGPVAPPPKSSKMSGLRLGGIIAGGVGLVGFGMFAGGGIASTGTYSDLKKTCGGDSGGCGGRNVDSQVSSGRTQQAIANAGLIIGIAGVATGATLIVLSTRKKGEPTTGLVVGPSYAGVHGEF